MSDEWPVKKSVAEKRLRSKEWKDAKREAKRQREGAHSAAQQIATIGFILQPDWVKDWSLAIDGGANVGDWTDALKDRFQRVLAVDAEPRCIELLTKRFGGIGHVEVKHAALLDKLCRVISKSPNAKQTGLPSKHVVELKNGDVEGITIDSLNLQSCGLIKLDIEGSELKALQGAVETIKRCKPCLVVEFSEKVRRRYNVDFEYLRAFIKNLGYTQVWDFQPDRVFICSK